MSAAELEIKASAVAVEVKASTGKLRRSPTPRAVPGAGVRVTAGEVTASTTVADVVPARVATGAKSANANAADKSRSLLYY